MKALAMAVAALAVALPLEAAPKSGRADGKEVYTRLVVLPDREAAERFAADVRSGTAFEEEAAKSGLSKDDIAPDGMTQSQLAKMSSPSIAAAVLAAPSGHISGPYDNQLGWIIFQTLVVEKSDGHWLRLITRKTDQTDVNFEQMRVVDGQRRVWIRFTETPKTGRKHVLMEYEAIDCSGYRSVAITTSGYLNGKLTHASHALPEAIVDMRMEPIQPDTLIDAVAGRVCKLSEH